MTYVVTENCIKCKYTDCVEVCPVDCFYEGENMLVINPDECIDCGVCVPECPAEAIFSDSEQAATPHWLELNRRYSEMWPNITGKKEPLPGADAQNGRPRKAAELSPLPGREDEAKALVCSPEPIPVCLSESGYFHPRLRREGNGTEAVHDRADYRASAGS